MRLLRPGAGVDVVDASRRRRPGSSGWPRTAGGAALQEQHLVVRRDRQQRRAGPPRPAAATAMKALLRWLISITDMPLPLPVGQLASGLLEHFQRQHRRSRGKIEYAHGYPSGRAVRSWKAIARAAERAGGGSFGPRVGAGSPIRLVSRSRAIVAAEALDALDARPAARPRRGGSGARPGCCGRRTEISPTGGAHQRAGRADQHHLVARPAPAAPPTMSPLRSEVCSAITPWPPRPCGGNSSSGVSLP